GERDEGCRPARIQDTVVAGGGCPAASWRGRRSDRGGGLWCVSFRSARGRRRLDAIGRHREETADPRTRDRWPGGGAGRGSPECPGGRTGWGAVGAVDMRAM